MCKTIAAKFMQYLFILVLLSHTIAFMIDVTKPYGYDSIPKNDKGEEIVESIPYGITTKRVVSVTMWTTLLYSVSALIEELMFRLPTVFLLFVIAQIFSLTKSQLTKISLSVILIASVIFGLLHGNFLNIMIQGVGGVVLTLFFMDMMSIMIRKYDTTIKTDPIMEIDWMLSDRFKKGKNVFVGIVNASPIFMIPLMLTTLLHMSFNMVIYFEQLIYILSKVPVA